MTNTFSKGDRVKYTGNNLSYFEPDRIGKFATVDSDFDFSTAMVKIVFDGRSEASSVYPKNIELVTPTHKFKAGDKVRYKDNHSIKYTIKNPKTHYIFNSKPAEPYRGEPAYDYEGKYGGWDVETTLELDVVEPTVSAINFKPGDKVVANRDISLNIKKGHKAEVLDFDGTYLRFVGGGFTIGGTALGGYWTASYFDHYKGPAYSHTFKAGDRVKHLFGDPIVIKDVRPADGFLLFEGYTSHGYCDYKHYEAAPHPTVTAIVAELLDGHPRPNENPRVHKTESEATAEAERLSKKHPGTEFGVFVMKSVSLSTKPVLAQTTTRAA